MSSEPADSENVAPETLAAPDSVPEDKIAPDSKLLPLPDVGDILFIFIVQVPLFLLPNFIFGDGSTGWHLVTGNYIIENFPKLGFPGAIPRTDLMSYTFPDKAWVAYEWLSDVLMALLVKAGGLNLLAVAVSAAIGFLFILLYDRMRREGCHFLFAVFLCLVGAIVSSIHWLVRPHLFTFFGLFIFATKLEDFYRGTISGARLALWLTLTMMVWVNCHPAFVIGIVTLFIYLSSTTFAAFFSEAGAQRNEFLGKAKWMAVTLALLPVAALVNPYGYHLFEYIVHYLKGSAVLAATDEFLSPVFHYALQPTCLELLFLFFVAGLVVTRAPLTFPRFLLCLAFAHLSLNAVRNMPLFAIISLPAIGQLYSSFAFKKITLAPFWIRLKDNLRSVNDGFTENEERCKMHLLPIGFTLLMAYAALNGGQLFGSPWLTAGFGAETKPTDTLTYLRKQFDNKVLTPEGGINYDNWGGYLRWKLGERVFIDDRADFYGEPFYVQYSRVSQTQPAWKDVLKQYDIKWVLFPNAARVTAALQTDPDWKMVAQDKASSLFVRKDIASLR